jgi:glutathione-independent formaldehyde dehydrogenase
VARRTKSSSLRRLQPHKFPYKDKDRSLGFHTGQAPVLRYNRQLMQAILHDRIQIGKIVNATIISLDDAPQGYKDFDSGAATKFVLDPNGYLAKAA